MRRHDWLAGGPPVQPAPGLPDRVTVYEVGARDGLQNESAVVPVDVKGELVRRLVAAGLTTVELTSFVRPGRVPQLADAEQLMADLAAHPAPGLLRAPVLVPNGRGLQRALTAGAREVAVFLSATEAFSEANLGTSRARALIAAREVCTGALQAGVPVRGYVSMCFGDPWEGPVAPEPVVATVTDLLDAGCAEVSLGDTIGVATAGQVTTLLDALADADVPREALAVHFHDTYGQALANTVVALQQGVTTVDASAGGLGGCPFAGSATGNLATEDLVWALAGLGVRTGVDLAALVATSVWLAGHLGRPSPSRVVAALAGPPAD